MKVSSMMKRMRKINMCWCSGEVYRKIPRWIHSSLLYCMSSFLISYNHMQAPRFLYLWWFCFCYLGSAGGHHHTYRTSHPGSSAGRGWSSPSPGCHTGPGPHDHTTPGRWLQRYLVLMIRWYTETWSYYLTMQVLDTYRDLPHAWHIRATSTDLRDTKHQWYQYCNAAKCRDGL